MNATVPKTPSELHTKRAELIARTAALGWTQNDVARRIGRNPGTYSRVLRGLITSAPVWIKAEQVIAREERRRSASVNPKERAS